MRRAILGSLLIVASVQPSAQSPPGAAGAADVRFEAASIKPNNSGGTDGGLSPRPGRVQATNATLRVLVMFAYALQGYEVVGGPGWIEGSRFDLTATTGGVTPIDQMRGMMQSLLRERFKLVTHRETRELPVWALALARQDGRLGPGLRKCAANCSTPGGGLTVGKLSLTGTPIPSLARTLSAMIRGPVVDQTSLSGPFDIDLEWSESVPTIEPVTTGVSIFTAVQEQLGLKLESRRGPVEVLVIDRAEPPSAD